MEGAYVYLHKKTTNNEVFYVGVGDMYGRKSFKRANNTSQRSEHWKRVFKKHGRTVEIIADNLDYFEARCLEIYLIRLYGRKDKGLGTLINHTDGGDGIKGLIWTDEHKKKVGDANRGKPNYFKGKKRPGNTAALKGNSHTLGKKLNNPDRSHLKGNNHGANGRGTPKPERTQSQIDNHRLSMIAKGHWKATA